MAKSIQSKCCVIQRFVEPTYKHTILIKNPIRYDVYWVSFFKAWNFVRPLIKPLCQFNVYAEYNNKEALLYKNITEAIVENNTPEKAFKYLYKIVKLLKEKNFLIL